MTTDEEEIIMNISMVIYILGWILNCQAGIMILPVVTGIIYGESATWSFVITMAICAILGILMVRTSPKKRVFYIREGFASVALSWIVLSISGALPFIFSGSIPSFIDAVFETVSGFTTTGASILSEVESLPKCILMWRSFTHWIGGMGVLVFILAILPMSGGYHLSLMKAESPGPDVSKLVPTVQSSAKILYGIYIIMTIIQLIILLISGMPVFDSITVTFGTAGTGGFGVRNSGQGVYTDFQQIVIAVFMILFGVNFNAYFLLLQRKFKDAFKMEEVRAYFAIILFSVAVITLKIWNIYGSFWQSAKHALFQVGSIITTTGYATTDFNLWDGTSKTILVILMMIGACAGSTGGGIKVSRILITAKTIFMELVYYIHPKAVRKIKIDGKVVGNEVLRNINVFLIAYFIIFAVSVFLISFDGFDLITNFTAVAATLNNIGPGLEVVGPTGNFGSLSILSKIVLIFDMLLGRLEIFPMLLLFSRDTWKKF